METVQPTPTATLYKKIVMVSPKGNHVPIFVLEFAHRKQNRYHGLFGSMYNHYAWLNTIKEVDDFFDEMIKIYEKKGYKLLDKPIKKNQISTMKLSTKQKAVLAKGQSLMKKAVALQKKSGTKTITVKRGGKAQKLEVYKINIKDALKKSKSGKKLF